MSESVTQREQTLREGVAEEIRALMARRNISRQTVAKALGVSHTTVWRRLSGDTALNLDELERVAEALGVEVVDLLPARREGRILTTVGQTPVGQGRNLTGDKARSSERTRPFGHPRGQTPHPSTRRPVRISLAHKPSAD